MEFQLLNRKLIIAETLQNYVVLRNSYYNQTNNCKEKFKKYLGNYKNIEELLEHVESDYLASIESALNFCVKKIIEAGTYDIDNKKIIGKLSEYGCFYSFAETKKEFLNAFKNMLSDEEKRAYNTKVNRSNRSQWSGGGFGLSGAIKGSLNAAVLNGGTGLLRGIADGIADSGSRATFNKKKNSLLDKRYLFIQALEITIDSIYDALIDIYSDELKIKKYNYNFDKEKSKSILNNIINGNINSNNIEDLIINILEKNPYEKDTYIFLLKKYPNKINEVVRIADYFNIDIDEQLDTIINDYYSRLPSSTSADLILSKAKFINFCDGNEINLNSSTVMSILNKQDDKIFKSQENDMTIFYNGLQFNELSDINSNKSMLIEFISTNNINSKISNDYLEKFNNDEETLKLKKLAEVYDKLPRNSEEDSISSKSKLLQISDTLGLSRENSIINKIDETIRLQNEAKRTVDGILYNNLDEVEKELSNKEDIAKIFESTNFSSLESIFKTIDQIQKSDSRLINNYIDILLVKANYMNIINNIDCYCVPNQLTSDLSKTVDINNLVLQEYRYIFNDDYKVIQDKFTIIKSNDYKKDYELVWKYYESKEKSVVSGFFGSIFTSIIFFFIIKFLIALFTSSNGILAGFVIAVLALIAIFVEFIETKTKCKKAYKKFKKQYPKAKIQKYS